MADDAEDKTEEPTQRRIDQAIERGDVATSQEINTFLVLAAFTLALLVAGAGAARTLVLDLRGFLMNLHLVPEVGGYLAVGRGALLSGLAACAVPVGAVALAGLAGGLMQHRLVFTLEPLMPQWSRVSPMGGIKRVLGIEAAANLVKGLAKVGVVGAVCAAVLWGERDRLDAAARIEPTAILGLIFAIALKLMAGVLAMHAVIAVLDALYARMRWRRRLRMTKQEIKEEHKESDGNPEVKGRIRQLRVSRARKRMMAAVPEATVVLANPTHFSVALRYEPGMAAPICVAKGVDALALRIRGVAAEHGVPVVENPPLARALYATVQIDDEIPVEHYRAVAEVIGTILRLKRRAA